MTPFTEASVITIFVHAILYGLYLTSLAHCMRWLLFDDEGLNIRGRISWSMLTITTAIFLLMTIDIGVEFHQTIGPASEVNSTAYNKMDTVTSAISLMVRLIFDAVLVYRCWIVCASSWRVALLPLLLWLCCLASAVVLIYDSWVFSHAKDAATAFTATTQIYKFLIVFYTCNIALNIYTTSAIIRRILQVAKISSKAEGRLHHLCRILLESGVPYAVTSVLVLATEVAAAEYSIARQISRNVIGTINFMLASICFNLILIRVGQTRVYPRLGHSDSSTTKQVALTTLQFSVATTQDRTVDLADMEKEIGIKINEIDDY